MEDISDKVGPLIKETDEPFQAVEVASADAKTAAHERIPGKKQSDQNPTAKASISWSKFGMKARARSFHLGKIKQLRLNHVSAPPNAPERLALTDVTSNLVDASNGKILRTDVDGMLTPSGMHRLKESDTTETSGKRSMESISSVKSYDSTSTEPFHLESLSADTDSAEHISKPRFSDPILPPTPIPERVEAGQPRAIPEKNVGDETEILFEDLNSLSLSRESSRAGTLESEPMATIPKIRPQSLTLPQTYGNPQVEHSITSKSVSNSIKLFSTPFTLTSPLFRHGPIRIDCGRPNLLNEEAMDLTAFHMAILGTVNSNASDDIAWELNEAEMDDITEWFDDFEFEGPGALIREMPNGRRGRRVT